MSENYTPNPGAIAEPPYTTVFLVQLLDAYFKFSLLTYASLREMLD